VFRGIPLRKLSRSLSATRAASVCAFFFAALHSQFLATLCLAFLLTSLYWNTRNLGVSMGAHSLYNLTVVGWMVLAKHSIVRPIGLVSLRDDVLVSGLATLIGIVGLYVALAWSTKMRSS
jgi:membrane protease YdiL (CAAX protease family)